MGAEKMNLNQIDMLTKYGDRVLSYASLNPDGTMRDELRINWPTFAMLNIFLSEAGSYHTLRENSVGHTWGAHIDRDVFTKALASVQELLKKQPTFGVDDGIKWSNGQPTREIIVGVVHDLLSLEPSDDNVVVLDYHNGTVCYCNYCEGFGPGKMNKQPDSTFGSIWKNWLLKQGNK